MAHQLPPQKNSLIKTEKKMQVQNYRNMSDQYDTEASWEKLAAAQTTTYNGWLVKTMSI